MNLLDLFDTLPQFILLAQEDAPPWWMPMALFGGLIFMFYFMVYGPQRRAEQERRSMLEDLKKNDRVVTKGGIIGIVTSVKKDTKNPAASEVTIKTHEDTRIDVLSSMIELKLAKKTDSKPE